MENVFNQKEHCSYCRIMIDPEVEIIERDEHLEDGKLTIEQRRFCSLKCQARYNDPRGPKGLQDLFTFK